jgi:hypothetical protein
LRTLSSRRFGNAIGVNEELKKNLWKNSEKFHGEEVLFSIIDKADEKLIENGNQDEV